MTTPTPHVPDNDSRSTLGAGGARSSGARRLVRLAGWILAILALAGAFWLGSRFGPLPPARPPALIPGPDTARVSANGWTCAMHPQIRQDGPGVCPICGMELVPVQVAGENRPARHVKYACAMMCVPPLDRPGQCPVCGMDMVPVEEYGGADPAGAAAAPSSRAITLSGTAEKLARLEVTRVERRFVAAEIRMVGKVDYDETRLRSISARVSGRLDKLYVDYTGVAVNKGEHLVSLYSPELLAAQQELIEAVKASRETGRGLPEDLRRMREESLGAARQKLQLWGLTQEQIDEAAQQGTPSDHLTIYAPIGGIVIDKRLVEGAYVEVGTEIYTIADLSRLWVKLDAYEFDLTWIRYGQSMEFITEAYPGETFHGTIAFIDPVLNDRTRTAKVRVNVPNLDGRLKPGMFVRTVVRSQLTAEARVMDPALAGQWICPMHPEVIAGGPRACSECGMPLVPAESLGYASASIAEAQPPLVIPVTAPLLTGPRAVVYVAVPDHPGRYEGREVVLGPRAGSEYLVREGLAEGERVVSQGNLYLDSAVQILARRSMMSPPADEASGGVAAPAGSTPAREPPPGRGESARTGPSDPLSEDARRSLDRIFNAYFSAHQSLSTDQLAGAKRQTDELLAGLRALNDAPLPLAARREWLILEPGLRKSIAGLAGAGDIASARAAYEGISNALITLGRQVGLGSLEQMRVYHCPMAFDNRGARWLQRTEGVENPYFGSAMPTCGVLKETLDAALPGPAGEAP